MGGGREDGGGDPGILANIPDVMVKLLNEHSTYAAKPGLYGVGDQTEGSLYAMLGKHSPN